MTEERINKVIELSKQEDVIDRLVRSIGKFL
jgi:DNA replicative helicase MCM subunit Mcm2 (Cdc46/Mcm family)